MHAKIISINGVEVLAQRLSHAGEMGWEFYVETEKAIIVWDRMKGRAGARPFRRRLQSP